jgi:hypothetical protein
VVSGNIISRFSVINRVGITYFARIIIRPVIVTISRIIVYHYNPAMRVVVAKRGPD